MAAWVWGGLRASGARDVGLGGPGLGVGWEAEGTLRPLWPRSTGCLHGNCQQPPGQEPAPGKSVTKQFLETVPSLSCVRQLGSGVPGPESGLWAWLAWQLPCGSWPGDPQAPRCELRPAWMLLLVDSFRSRPEPLACPALSEVPGGSREAGAGPSAAGGADTVGHILQALCHGSLTRGPSRCSCPVADARGLPEVRQPGGGGLGLQSWRRWPGARAPPG